MNLLDLAVVGWFAVAIALLILQQFDNRASRIARLALTPLAIALFIAALWNFGQVFGTMIVASQS